MPAGKPKSAGTSNDAMVLTNKVSTVAMMAGYANFKVMRRSVFRMLEPLMTADSSSEGSMALKADDMSKNAMGEQCSASTQIMPHME